MESINEFLSRPWRVSVFFFLLAGVLYANTISNTWAIDDGVIIHNSRAVRKGLRGIPALIGSDFLESSTGRKIGAVAGSRYRPLTPVIFAALANVVANPATDSLGNVAVDDDGTPLCDLGEHTIFPHVLHLLNMLAYTILCVVLYRALRLMLNDRPQAPLIAFLTTLLYTVHPIHAEAVANAKGLDEILAMLFALLSLNAAFLAVDDRNGRRWSLATSAAFLLLACLSKENAITFIAIIPLAILVFRPMASRSSLRCGITLLISAAFYLVLRTVAVGGISPAVQDPMNMMNDPFLEVAQGQRFVPLLPGSEVMVLEHPTQHSIVPMPEGKRLATVAYTWLQYLKLFIAPVDLSYDYYPKQIATRSVSDPAVLLSLLMHGAALAWAIVNFRRGNPVAFGILFYILSFSVVSNLLIPVGTNMAERFLFMPSAGLCMIAATGLAWLSQRFSRTAVLVGAAAVASLFAIRTVARNFDWKNNLTLIGHDLEIAVNSAKIRSDYGEVVLKELGGSLRSLPEADRIALLKSTLPLYRQALDVYPMYGLVWFNLARTNLVLGESGQLPPDERLRVLQTAAAAFDQTMIYKPVQYLSDIDTLRSRCFASLGKLYGEQFGDLPNAVFYLRSALALNSRNSHAKFLLGTAHDLSGRPDSAEYYARAAYETDPANRDYAENYAQIIQKNIADAGSRRLLLEMAARLLNEVAAKNAAIPLNHPDRTAIQQRTSLLIKQNQQLKRMLENDGR